MIFFAALAPRSLDPEGREGDRREGGSAAEHPSVREEGKKRGKDTSKQEGESDEGRVTAVTCVSMPPAVCHFVSAYKHEPGTRK